jgi:hypothetical protein
MPEDKEARLPVPPELGHQIDVGEFLYDIGRLMAAVLSAQQIAILWDKRGAQEGVTALRTVVEGYQAREVPRLLVSLAAMFRIKQTDGSWRAKPEYSVGWLCAGSEIDPECGELLTLREACNKIIHADQVESRYESAGERVHFSGTVYELRGKTQGGKPWVAELNLIELAIALVNVDFSAPVCPH